MREERLFRVLNLIDDDLIEEAAEAVLPAASRRKPSWRSFATLAACMALVASLSLSGGFRGCGASAPPGMSGNAAPGEDAGSGNTAGGASFLSYAGPVLPLTLDTAASGLTAARTVTYDFAVPEESVRTGGATVTDSYVVYNSSPEAVTVRALYPVVGSLSDLAEASPQVTIAQKAVTPTLYAGPYAGGFQGIDGDEEGRWNLNGLNSWTDYASLLEDGSYQAQALAGQQPLAQEVVVYEFTDSTAPLEDFPAATQAVSFTIDQEATTVLSYGFNGLDWDDETGFRQYSYFVPDETRMEAETKSLVVLGEDIGSYRLAGYQNGDSSPGNALDGVSCTITRRESTLGAVLDELGAAYLHHYQTNLLHSASALTLELYQQAVAELLTDYGPLSSAVAERYSDGRLDDLFAEALNIKRVLYLTAPLTIPAGESVTLSAVLRKAPSYDFGGTGTGREGLQGYDLTTTLGSNLSFTSLDIRLVNIDDVQIVEENLGLTPGEALDSLPLDLSESRYYLTIQPLE